MENLKNRQKSQQQELEVLLGLPCGRQKTANETLVLLTPFTYEQAFHAIAQVRNYFRQALVSSLLYIPFKGYEKVYGSVIVKKSAVEHCYNLFVSFFLFLPSKFKKGEKSPVYRWK